MRGPLLLLSALLLVSAGLLATSSSIAQGGDQAVIMVDVTGTITQGTTLHIEAALAEAESRGVPLLLRLDTPGGLVDATLEVDRLLAAADVPVLTFVGPQGGFAASAGTFMLLMGQPSGMAPSTSIGSAQPVQVGPSGQAMPAGEKAENFLAARIRAIAERTDRDPDVAERFVTENLNLGAEEARDMSMVDVVAGDVRAFLDAVDGMSARTGSGAVVLETEGARIVTFDKPFLAQVVDILGNPQIAFVLVLAGTYALIFGLANPGSYVPEVLGAVILLLGFIGLGLFDTTTAGVLLLLLGVLFLVIEVFTPTHGVLAGAGVIAILFAAVFLLRNEPLLGPSFLRIFYFAGLGLAVTSGAVTLGAVSFALTAHRRPVHDALRGAEGVVLEPLAPEGRVVLHEEIWRARAAQGEIGEGERVRVVSHAGLMLTVEPLAPDDDGGGRDDDGDAPGDADGTTPGPDPGPDPKSDPEPGDAPGPGRGGQNDGDK